MVLRTALLCHAEVEIEHSSNVNDVDGRVSHGTAKNAAEQVARYRLVNKQFVNWKIVIYI